MLPRVIAICGLKRSGKDTIADYLCEEHGYEKIKIAAPLKDALKVMFGFSDEQIEGDSKDVIDIKWGITPRKVMQFFGTEVMQYQIQDLLPNVGRTFWIKSLMEQHISKFPHKKYVIPDLRFKHEYTLLNNANCGVEFWMVERKRSESSKSCINSECSHSSEREYLEIPVCQRFVNETKQKLYKDIDEYLESIGQT
jgi:hypothetical protein